MIPDKLETFSRTRIILTILIICLIFIPILSYITHFCLTTNYTSTVFHKEGFLEQYGSGIYKFRVAGRLLFLKVYHFLEASNIQLPLYPGLLVKDPEANWKFYCTYFIINTTFSILLGFALFYLMTRKAFRNLSFSFISILILFILILIHLSLYVLTFYDIMSYFFIMLSVISGVIWKNRWLTALIIIAGTTVRESQALVIPFFLALFIYNEDTDRIKKDFSLYILSFFIMYFALRIYYGFHSPFIQSIMLGRAGNVQWWFGIIAGLTILSFPMLFAERADNRKIIRIFYLLCIPYFIFILIAANIFEFRLIIPVFLLGAIATWINPDCLSPTPKTNEPHTHEHNP